MRFSSNWLIFTILCSAAGTGPLRAQAVNGKPYAISVSPSFGNGFDQTFQFIWADPDGFEDLSQLQVIFSPTYEGTKPGEMTCTIGIATSSRALTLLDANGKWSPPSGIGSKDNLENEACKVDASASSISGAGKQLTATLHVKFKKSMSGPQFITMRAWDQNINLSANDPNRKNEYDMAVPGSWTVGKRAACQATFSRRQERVDDQSHDEAVSVNAAPGCRWAASSGVKWISIQNNGVAKGSGDLSYKIAANPSGSPRQGAIFIGPVYLAIQQAGSHN